MSNKKKIASIAFTGVAAAAAVGVNAGPAFASAKSHWTVNPGGSFTAHATNGTKLVDTTHPVSLNCRSASAGGSLLTAASGNPANLGRNATTTPSGPGAVSFASFIHCSILGVAFNAHLNKPISSLWAKSFSNSTATGWLGKKASQGGSANQISATISGSGNNCHATVTGSFVPAAYHNNGTFAVNPTSAATLTIHSPKSCPVIQNGDQAFFQANFTVNPVQTVDP